MRLSGKSAIVTGGGTGIGRAVCLMLAKEGASVAVNYSKSETEAVQTLEEIRKLGASGLAVRADVSSDTEVRGMAARVLKTFGRIDILVNNAAFTRFINHTDLEAMTEDVWDRIFAVNLKGLFFCCRAVTPAMKKQGSGRIVNVSSIAGLNGRGSCIAYAASKAGVVSVTKSLARALGPEILVNAVAPGLVETRWLDGTANASDLRRNFVNDAVIKHVGRPEDVAEVVLTLVSDWTFVTGQTVVVDGGRTV